MQQGQIVIVKECHKIPELVGQTAIVLQVFPPEAGKYPITVGVQTGEHKGKTANFREEELEILPKGTEGIPDIFLNT